MQKTSRNLLIGIAAVVVIVIAIVLFFVFGRGTPAPLVWTEVKNGNVTEQVDLTGQVQASQGVDLAFQSQGEIVANYVKVGDKIYTGEPLLAIDSSLLQSQLKQAQAQLDALDINTVESKTNAGLQALYATGLSSSEKSVGTAKDILLTISDIQFNHFTGQTPQNSALQSAKTNAVDSLLGQSGAGLWTSQNIAQLNGGAYGLVQIAVSNPTQDNIDAALLATQKALQDISTMVNDVPIDPSLTAAERSTISLVKTNINLEIITTSANIQAIATTKVNNSAIISTTGSQIEAAQANIDAIKTQISKTVITALFNGQVDKDNALVGQIVSPNIPVITISNDSLEINTSIPEVDLSETKIGGSANVTLDAFGGGLVFPATIISVDSAPSIANGISAYGSKLKFNTPDNRIKPGMTANITIISDTHKNVLIVPKTAVIERNNEYFVIVDKGGSNNGYPQKEVRQVTVGLRDSQNIEITSGLKLGEKVFAY